EDFIRNHPDHVTKFYQDEAAPVTIPWHPRADGQPNLTLMMKMARETPLIRANIDKAANIEKQWAALDLAQLHADNERNRSRRESAEKLLAPPPAPAGRSPGRAA